MNFITNTLALVSKDIRSEVRTRYAVNALLMFVVTSVATILFALHEDELDPEILSGMFWIVVFFTSMSGLSRIFVSEEERGTTLTLQLIASPSVIYFGKLIFNCALTVVISCAITFLYMIVFPAFVIKSAVIFLITVILGSLGFASVSTIVAAIISRSQTKGTLFAVLSFPILVPLLLTVISATDMAIKGGLFFDAFEQIKIMVGYIAVVVGVSYLLFDYVWKD
jgi:heme exporter protein B